jgi:nucleoid-associated protein YgaU
MAVTYEVRGRAVQPATQAVYWRRRLVALVLFAGLVLALATMAGRLRSVPHAASEPGSIRTELVGSTVHVVQPGDTLWSIAQRYAPARDPFETIDEIRRLNGITDYTVRPGQRLIIPRR